MPFADLMLQASEWLDEDLHPFENNNSEFSAVTGYPYTIPVNQGGITHTLKRIIWFLTITVYIHLVNIPFAI